MRPRLISFDLQGTLSAHDFSSEVWLKLLPEEIGSAALLDELKQTGEDDPRYYDLDYWLGRAGSSARSADLARRAAARPRIFAEMRALAEELASALPVILVSATTREFIELELGAWRAPFAGIYSTFDDFKAPGKPPWVFSALSEAWGLAPQGCLHIGDHPEMDGSNPRAAGWLSLYAPSDIPPLERAMRVRARLKALSQE